MFNVVIITATGGIISRPAGSDFQAAIDKANDRRQDFPDAQEIRVVQAGVGVLYTC